MGSGGGLPATQSPSTERMSHTATAAAEMETVYFQPPRSHGPYGGGLCAVQLLPARTSKGLKHPTVIQDCVLEGY